MLRYRLSKTSSEAPFTQEDTGSLQANRHRTLGPVDTSYAISEGGQGQVLERAEEVGQ